MTKDAHDIILIMIGVYITSMQLDEEVLLEKMKKSYDIWKTPSVRCEM